jgi:hypothetical protein
MYTLLKPAAANRIQMKKRQTDLMAWARAVSLMIIKRFNIASARSTFSSIVALKNSFDAFERSQILIRTINSRVDPKTLDINY